jgi:hypothetical protein
MINDDSYHFVMFFDVFRCFLVLLIKLQYLYTDGKPHIHMVIKTNKILKSYNKLPKLLKDWGNTDFRLFEKSKSTRCISYLSKEYHNHNFLWGIK